MRIKTMFLALLLPLLLSGCAQYAVTAERDFPMVVE